MNDENDYPSRKLLQFVMDILNEADRSSGTGLSVIPVIFVGSMASATPLLQACFRHANVTLIDAAGAIDGIEVNGTINPALKRRVETLTSNLGEETKSVVVHESDGSLTVRLEGEGTPTNPGTRNFLGALTALLDPAIDRRSHVVLRYDETSMSEDNYRQLWDLLVHDLSPFFKNLTTLTVITSVPQIDQERHFGVDSGVLWIFDRGQIQHRQRPEQDRDKIGRIAESDKPLILMLGAGASRSSNLPQGNELRDEALKRRLPWAAKQGDSATDLARKFYSELRDNNRLMDGEDDVDEFVNELTLERVLREEAHFCAPDQEMDTLAAFRSRETAALDSPGPAVRATRELLKLRRRIVLMTVNFDRLIEHGAQVLKGLEEEPSTPGPDDPPSIRTFVEPDDFANFREYYETYRRDGGPVPLLKLHGTIEQVETVRATVDVTYPGLDEATSDALRALLPPTGDSYHWVYVGCSMRDRDISTVIAAREFAERTNEHWVSPSVDPNVETWVATHRVASWRAAQLADNLGERSITQTADSFMTQLVDWLIPGESDVTLP